MRVVLHRITDHVCYFIVATVFKLAHGMQNTALHWFQTVGEVRHGTLHDHVAGVIQKVISIHAPQILMLVRATILGVISGCKI